jgi:hypothetical protein
MGGWANSVCQLPGNPPATAKLAVQLRIAKSMTGTHDRLMARAKMDGRKFMRLSLMLADHRVGQRKLTQFTLAQETCLPSPQE